jgi:hypothetical protein
MIHLEERSAMNPLMSEPDQRRSYPRNPFQCFARYRMLDAASSGSDLLCITKDFSHDGLYFLALNDQIRRKMQLLLKFPYLTDSGSVDRECLVEVVRTHDLFPGRFGVGVRLIGLRSPVEPQSRLVVPDTNLSTCPAPISIDLYA